MCMLSKGIINIWNNRAEFLEYIISNYNRGDTEKAKKAALVLELMVTTTQTKRKMVTTTDVQLIKEFEAIFNGDQSKFKQEMAISSNLNVIKKR